MASASPAAGVCASGRFHDGDMEKGASAAVELGRASAFVGKSRLARVLMSPNWFGGVLSDSALPWLVLRSEEAGAWLGLYRNDCCWCFCGEGWSDLDVE